MNFVRIDATSTSVTGRPCATQRPCPVMRWSMKRPLVRHTSPLHDDRVRRHRLQEVAVVVDIGFLGKSGTPPSDQPKDPVDDLKYLLRSAARPFPRNHVVIDQNPPEALQGLFLPAKAASRSCSVDLSALEEDEVRSCLRYVDSASTRPTMQPILERTVTRFSSVLKSQNSGFTLQRNELQDVWRKLKSRRVPSSAMSPPVPGRIRT